MFMYIVIKFFNEDDINSGRRRIYLNENRVLRNIVDEIKSIGIDKITKGITFLVRKDDGLKNINLFEIKNIDITDQYIELEFHIDRTIEIDNTWLSKRLYKKSKEENYITDENKFSPDIIILNENDIVDIEKKNLQIVNTKFTSVNGGFDDLYLDKNWNEVYRYFGDIEKLKEDKVNIWNDKRILNNIAFAASKLSAVGTIDKEIRKNKNKLNIFLSEKKKIRYDAEVVYKRVIELDSNNPGSYSNLGYLYYQNVMDLTIYGGRRDDKTMEQGNLALEYINKALSINDNRIKDLYRKGYMILNKLLPVYDGEDIERFTEIGVDSLRKVILCWEDLDESEKKEKDRCRKEYVKALYNIAKAQEERKVNYWNMVVKNGLYMGKMEILFKWDITKTIRYLQEAKTMAIKCWEFETGEIFEINKLNAAVISKNVEKWVVEPSDQLYRLGCIYLDIYWIISGSNKYNYTKEQKDNFIESANKLLSLSRQVKMIKNHNQRKKYITEKIARVEISKGNIDDAIRELESLGRISNDYYIINLLGFAYFQKGDYDNAIKVIEPIVEEKFNQVKNQSLNIIFVAAMKGEKIEIALKYRDAVEKNKHISKEPIIKVFLEKLDGK